jgi:hypothetical protein
MTMARIIDKVQEKKAAMLADPTGQLGRDNAKLAIDAIHAGISSVVGSSWEKYMRQYVDNNNPEQIGRLLATDSSASDDEQRMRRAYLVGNAVCATTTTGTMDYEVASIDNGIGDVCP